MPCLLFIIIPLLTINRHPEPKNPQAHYALCVYYARTGDAQAADREFKILQGLDKNLAQKLAEPVRK